MYCAMCGMENLNTAKYCTACGAVLMNEMRPNAFQNNGQSEVLTQLNNAYAYFCPKAEAYVDYSKTCMRLSNFDKTHGFGVIWIPGGLIFLYVLGFINNRDLFPAILLFVIAIISVFLFYLLLKRTYAHEYQNLSRHARVLAKDLAQHYQAYPNCPVSYEYSEPYIIYTIRNTIASGRADSVKEAINLMHNETQQQQIYQQIQQGTKASKATAAYSAGNFFLNLFKR